MTASESGPKAQSHRNTTFLSPHRRSHAWRLVFAVVLLLITAVPIERGAVSDLEARIFFWFNDLYGWITGPLWIVMQLGALIAVPVVALAALVMRNRRLALDVLIAGTLAWLLANVVKEAVGRARPHALLADVVLRGETPTGLGYVSGHAAVSCAMAAVIAPYLSFRGKVVVWCLAGAVCVARVYMGVHLPLDVVGGAAMGWALGSLVHFVFGEPERPNQRRTA